MNCPNPLGKIVLFGGEEIKKWFFFKITACCQLAMNGLPSEREQRLFCRIMVSNAWCDFFAHGGCVED